MKPQELKGEAKALYESFRGMGLSEAAAMTATAGRSYEIGLIESGRAFGRIGVTEAARQIEAVKSRPAAASDLVGTAYDTRSARAFSRSNRGQA